MPEPCPKHCDHIVGHIARAHGPFVPAKQAEDFEAAFCYRRDGTPYEEQDVLVWARDFEKADRVVAQTATSGGDISTVWLGLDHNWFGVGPPLIFETMVFGGPLDGEQERYATEADAIAGHAAMVERVRRANN